MTINYRDTLNLPNTDFSMKAGLPRKEPEILDLWSRTDIYGKIRKKYKNNNVKNLKTNISNSKIKQSVNGNTNTVYINPMNSLLFVLKKLQKDKIKHDKDFYVFTGSSVGVVPILNKGIYKGTIEKLGSVKTKIN